MNKVAIIGLLVAFGICSFCKKDFEVLNSHSWRCKEKLKHKRNKGNHGNNSVSNSFNTVNLDRNEIVNNDCHKCTCAKKCKGFCGLKVHQSSCRAITSLSNNIVINNIKQDATKNHFEITNNKQDEFHSLKEGVRLTKSLEDWHLANMYFHSELLTINIKNNLNEAMSLMNSTVYNYFCDHYGYKNTIRRVSCFEVKI